MAVKPPCLPVAPCTFFALLFLLTAATFGQNFSDVKPTPYQLEWQNLEFGVIIHFGLNTYTNKEWGDGTVSPRVFNPTDLDAGQWVRAAKSAGARYVIFVAKHHDGFCLWPTHLTNYSVASSPWEGGQGDVVRLVSDACRQYGLKFGVYLSPWDRHEPFYKNDAAYDKFYEGQVAELATHYGPLEEWWLDGAGSAGHVYDFKRYLLTLRTYQPNTLIFSDVGLLPWADIRWVGNEAGIAPKENWDVIDRAGYLRWRPAECDTPLHKLHWFWHPNDAGSLKSLPELLEIYNHSVGRGCNLLLGIAPDERGLIPQADVARLAELGAALRKIYAKNLAPEGTLFTDVPGNPNASAAADNDPGTFWRAPSGVRHATIELDFAKPITFDRTVTMEWLIDGQQIQKYQIQAWENGKWEILHDGSSIGHKKIDIFPITTASKVRLRILDASGPPALREFQIYNGAGSDRPE
ncbi:MAG: alpha-L-fucosidase [Acidobacteriota bacterium]|nr:alpha-L-fucosidase [Acidobacteriota bacterium]